MPFLFLPFDTARRDGRALLTCAAMEPREIFVSEPRALRHRQRSFCPAKYKIAKP
ncbi:hypothetical protein SAMN05216236_13250 [Sedimentitalea nanhaiensis]|uniref:Uncharacterized protein n=1 Tax=Sedimentitalea nanhaiensis TaxID=999627 RepID=A0A1I7DQX7_9RHOB|nr:hypothetical protein SAMN05216236_13250 [Sedimentitalea nanhaiensis]